MRDYEVTVLLKPSLSDKDLEKAVKEVETSVSKAGGKLNKEAKPVKRAMAYEIEKVREANYLYIETKMNSNEVSKVNELLRNDNNVIRFLIVVRE